MLKKIIFIICVSVFCQMAYTSEDDCDNKLYHWEKYVYALWIVRDTYNNEDFERLDYLLECLVKNPDKRFPSGKSGYAAAYWFFRKEISGPIKSTEVEERVGRWIKERPNSKYAQFGLIRLTYAKAWTARGGRYSNKTDKDAFAEFFRLLKKAEEELGLMKNGLEETPLHYNLLLAITLDYPSQTSAKDVFFSSVDRWPDYYDFYQVLLSRMVPKWGGSWEVVDQFILNWSQILSNKEGDTMYARLYYSVHNYKVDPKDTKVDWFKLKSSLKAINKLYPSDYSKLMALSYGCYYDDIEFYKIYRDVMAASEARYREFWIKGTSVEICREKFEEL